MPSVKDDQIKAELRRLQRYGPNAFTAELLCELRNLETEYESIAADKRTPETIRHYATSLLFQTLPLLISLRVGSSDDSVPSPLMHLLSALYDLERGLNSRLLVTGDLAGQLPNGRHSAGRRQIIRANAAAIVEYLLLNRIEQTQMKAAARVANSLNRGGYAPPGETRLGHRNRADTVKRWHNSARSGRHALSERFNMMLQTVGPIEGASEFTVSKAERALDRLEQSCKTYRLVDE